MPDFETIETDATVAACNGGGGAMGHPRVYLNLIPAGRIECPYCSRTFVNPRLTAHGAGPAIGAAVPPEDQAREERRGG
jgi:uncharacterized Zn-finger protein